MNRRRLLMQSSGGIDPVTGRGFVNGYEVVDLGLSNGLLFATCNVGADEETDYGDYYMYGKGSRKYTYGDSRYEGTENPLASSADTATQVMGEGWRMPTRTELQDLISKTDYKWVTNFNGSGINGGKFTSKTNPNAYIFFPAAGRYNDGTFSGGSSEVWSSTPYSGQAYKLELYYSSSVSSLVRYMGLSVRGVTSVGGGKLTLFKRILNFLKSLVKKGGKVC